MQNHDDEHSKNMNEWKTSGYNVKTVSLQYINICTKLFNIHSLDIETNFNLEKQLLNCTSICISTYKIQIVWLIISPSLFQIF